MTLAIFDLDNTLLRGDSDYAWGQFLCERKLVNPQQHAQQNERFYQEYLQGVLDIHEFLRFQLKPLAKRSRNELNRLREEYLRQYIAPMVTNSAHALVNKHREQGHHLMIVTATNSFVTRPIAAMFGIDTLIATEPEILNGEFTGNIEGIPSYREGKVTRLNEWLKEHDHNLRGSWFYSDSHNDLPLLEAVENPVAVNPDESLASIARKRGWDILHLE